MEKILFQDRSFLHGQDFLLQRKFGDTSYQIHGHEYYEMIYYRDCGGQCILNGQEYPITASCLFLLTPKDFHKINAVNTEKSGSVILSFTENYIDEKWLSRLGFTARVLYDPPESTVQLIDAMTDLYESEGAKSQRLYHRFNAVIADVVSLGKAAALAPSISPLIRKAMTIALAQLSEPVSVEMLASRCGMTASYFSALFHKQTGQTFLEWLTDTRIQRACHLLEETTLSVLEIGYECGYTSQSQFLRMFRRCQNCTPTEYRKKLSAASACFPQR